MSSSNSPQRAVTTREEFSAREVATVQETASSAVAAREKAAIEARYIIALKRPRDMESVRVKMLKECDRPRFAEVARFKKPVGKREVNGRWVDQFVEGPSIRFAEVALRCMMNVYPEQSIVYEDDAQRIVRVTVTDLEGNVSYSSEILVKKTVERKKPREGQEVISARENSSGQKVYLVYASDDEVLIKQNALISKAIRNNGLRLVPGDIIEECMDRIIETQRARDKEDPDAAKRKVIDAFAETGIEPSDLQAYLGHSLDRIQPVELADLRAVYAALRDGETTWEAVMDARQPTGTVEAAAKIAEEKLAKARAAAEEDQKPAGGPPTEEEMNRITQESVEQSEGEAQAPPPKPVFGRRK